MIEYKLAFTALDYMLGFDYEAAKCLRRLSEEFSIPLDDVRTLISEAFRDAGQNTYFAEFLTDDDQWKYFRNCHWPAENVHG